MAEWTLKYADARGEIHQQVAEAGSEGEIRIAIRSKAFWCIRSSRARTLAAGRRFQSAQEDQPRKVPDLQSAIRNAGARSLPILKALDLLAERLTDPKLSVYIKGVRQEVRNGALLSEAFARQGVFPAIYVTTVLAGERSGSLAEVIERFITYQKLSLSVRKKLLVSLMYPAVLISLVSVIIVFLVTYVVPNFAQLIRACRRNCRCRRRS